MLAVNSSDRPTTIPFRVDALGGRPLAVLGRPSAPREREVLVAVEVCVGLEPAQIAERARPRGLGSGVVEAERDRLRLGPSRLSRALGTDQSLRPEKTERLRRLRGRTAPDDIASYRRLPGHACLKILERALRRLRSAGRSVRNVFGLHGQ
jgi:hypothetical protein